RRRDHVRSARHPRALGRPRRVPRGRTALLGGSAVRRLGRARRSRGWRLGDAPRLRPFAPRSPSARHRSPSRARPGDHARPRARVEPLPVRAAGRAAGVTPRKFQAPRGTHDVLPAEAPWWQLVAAMEEVTRLYGYGRIQTPGFEDTGLFVRTSGEASDVVHKEMYTFSDRSDRSLTLRPEGTAPIARAYIAHGLHREAEPVKLYTIAPMYRYGAPGRGRYREHYQLSVEAIGSDAPAIDAEVIQLYCELLRRLGVTQWELNLNSIGDAKCRPQYVQRLNAWLDAHPDALDEEARHKRATSPLQVFDVKTESVREALADAPKIGESLCDECRDHFERVRAALDVYRVPYVIDSTLVRGLDYYTRTTFEFI